MLNEHFFERRFYDAHDKLTCVWQCEAGLWNQYRVSQQDVVIRSPDQLPGIGPVDPRQLATLKIGESLDDLLRLSRITQAERVEESEYGSGTIEITLEAGGGKQSLKLSFGSNSRFLPVRSTLFSSNGTALRDKTFEYQLVEARDALVLRTARTVFDVDPSVTDPKLRQMLFLGETVLAVDRYELIDEDAIAQRRMAEDSNWTVHDMTKWNPQVTRAEGDGTERDIGDKKPSFWRRSLLIASVLVILIIPVALLLRKSLFVS